MNELLLDTDLEEALESGEVPSAEDEATVEKYLRALRYYRSKVEEAEDRARNEVERIESWKAREQGKAQRSVDYLTARLQQFSLATGKARRTSPNGTLSWIKGRPHVEVTDEFMEIHADSPWVRWKAEPDKKALMDHIKTTGELPEGADLVTGPDVFKVTT